MYRPQQLEFLPFQGRVNLSAPEHVFALLLDYGENPNDVPTEPYRMFFGRQVSLGSWLVTWSIIRLTQHETLSGVGPVSTGCDALLTEL